MGAKKITIFKSKKRSHGKVIYPDYLGTLKIIALFILNNKEMKNSTVSKLYLFLRFG